MSLPLLTKVLHHALTAQGNDGHFGPYLGEWPCEDTAARIPPDIADRLERALDVCSECGLPDKGYIREGADFDEVAHEDWMRHPYQPLVTP